MGLHSKNTKSIKLQGAQENRGEVGQLGIQSSLICSLDLPPLTKVRTRLRKKEARDLHIKNIHTDIDPI